MQLAQTTRGLVVTQIAALWVAVFALGLTHQMGVISALHVGLSTI